MESSLVSEGNGEAHFHTMQRLFPVFCILGSINYLRYSFWYFEKMRKPQNILNILKHSEEGKCLVKINVGYFKSVAPDMKFQESKEYLIFQKAR